MADLRWPDFSDYRGDVEAFYARAGHAPAWLNDGHPTPPALQMIDVLQKADSEGLRAEDYDSSRWRQRLASLQGQASESDEVHFDLALTVCALRYVSDLWEGRLKPRQFNFVRDVGPKKMDLSMFVWQRLANGQDLQGELASLEPPLMGYQELRKALWTYMDLARRDDGEKLPMPTDLGYPGPPYPGFARLARLLLLLGDLPADYSIEAASSQKFDPDLLQGVQRFQKRHGLSVTGYLNAETVEQLNVPLRHRVEQIQLALERYRWLRNGVPHPAILVNIPGFHLYALNEKGKIALAMRVDVGEDFDRTRTPLLEDSIDYLVFRPYWDVPLNIQINEVIPIVLEDPGYLREYGFEIVTPGGQATTNFKVTRQLLQDLRTGRLHLRQRPGSRNPMGLLKFVFPNRYSVYLHDVPVREINFILPHRVVSHGCIHVEQPAELAAWMLRDKPEWNLGRVRRAMDDGKDNRRVDLGKPLPVLIFYTTVSTWQSGQIHFYRDIYGYDADLLHALAQGYPSRNGTKVKGRR